MLHDITATVDACYGYAQEWVRFEWGITSGPKHSILNCLLLTEEGQELSSIPHP